jgi:hypothetical protein
MLVIGGLCLPKTLSSCRADREVNLRVRAKVARRVRVPFWGKYCCNHDHVVSVFQSGSIDWLTAVHK